MQRNMKIEAYMTVEASVVIPILLFSMVLLMYMTIYVYNKVLLIQDNYTVLIYARDEYRNNPKKVPENMDKYFSMIKAERPYFSTDNLSMSIRKERNELQIRSSVNFFTPFGEKGISLYEDKNGVLNKDGSIYVTDPISIMLITRDFMEK